MKIFVNGEQTECESGCTVDELITRHGLVPETALVERNGIALRRGEWRARELQESDRLEILRVAAGG